MAANKARLRVLMADKIFKVPVIKANFHKDYYHKGSMAIIPTNNLYIIMIIVLKDLQLSCFYSSCL